MMLFANENRYDALYGNNLTSLCDGNLNSPHGTYTIEITTTQEIKCNGQTGKIKAKVVPAPGNTVTGIQYKWSNGSTNPEITVPAGTYTVTVTSTNSPTQSANYSLSQPSVLNFKISSQTEGCNNQNGIVGLKFDGGVMPYKVQVLNASTSTVVIEEANINTTSITLSIPPGSYKYKIIDANLCSNLLPTIITTRTTFKEFNNIGLTITPITCNGSADGKFVITPEQIITGFPIEYIILVLKNGVSVKTANFVTSMTVSNLSPGDYEIRVFSASVAWTCTRPLIQFVNLPEPSLVVNTGDVTVVDCFGNATGQIVNTTSGGNGGYKYAWSNGAVTKDIMKLTSGTYTVTITDSKGCHTSPIAKSFFVNQPTQIVTTGNVTDVDCFNNSTGKIVTTTTGGNGGIVYNWSNGATTKDILKVKAGTYNLSVTDSKNCKTNPAVLPFTIKQPDQLTNSVTVTTIDCFGANNGKLISNPSGGNGAYTYSWSNGANTKIISGLKPGDYKLIISDSKDCKTNPVLETFVITQPDKVVNKNNMIKDADCFDKFTGEIIQNIEGGVSPFTYIWRDGVKTSDRINMHAGKYSCTVTDANKCVSNYDYEINQSPEIIANPITINPETPSIKGSITMDVHGGAGSFEFTWLGPNGFTSSSKDISGLSKGDYNLTVQDANGCAIDRIFTVPFSTANIDDSNEKIELSVFNNIIIIKNLNQDVEYNIQILSMDGKIVQSKTFRSSSKEMFIPVEKLHIGTYFARITNKNINYISQFIKL